MGEAQPPLRKRRSRWRILLRIVVLISAAIACMRPALPSLVRWYVNRILDRNLLYEGRIGDVTLNLWRGAYSISDIRLIKRTGNVPIPLLHAKTLELAVQWNAILHGKIVGQVVMQQPELNFVDASADAESQTGGGGGWLNTLSDLFPFKLNSVQIHDGSIHFRSYKTAKPVDVYLNNLEASVDDLTNIQQRTTPMLTTVKAKGLAMNQAKFEFNMKLNPFAYRPTFHMATRLLGLDVTKTNDLALAYGQFDFKGGWFDLVVEVDASEGQLQGYAKPLFRNLKVFDIPQDIKNDRDPLQFFWQAILGRNYRRIKKPVARSIWNAHPLHRRSVTTEHRDPLNHRKRPAKCLRASLSSAPAERHQRRQQQYNFSRRYCSDPISAGDQP